MPAQRFPLGYPALELVGAEFVGNLTRYELMEFRILSGGHAAIAYPGALLGHHLVHDAMADPRIASWLDALTRREIQPTLSPVQGASDDNYRRLIAERFSNPHGGRHDHPAQLRRLEPPVQVHPFQRLTGPG